jgi:cellulose biosynthesis protein BcsQ
VTDDPNSTPVWNGKGGVIKTSLTANQAGIAATGGWHVLTIDLSAQGSRALASGRHNVQLSELARPPDN